MADSKATYSELKKATNYRFKPGEVVVPKFNIKMPMSPEREYLRVVNTYMNILKGVVQDGLPKIKEFYKPEIKEKKRTDAESDLITAITLAFNDMGNELTERLALFDLEKFIRRVAITGLMVSTRQWRNIIKKAIGIDIREDYYLGEFFRENLDDWIVFNVDLIKTIPNQTLNRMKEIVYKGYITGLATTAMANEIMAAYGVSKRRAMFIARDQCETLYAQVTKAQQTDAGVTMYEWSNSDDQRVRPSHRELGGTRHRWDDPPETDGGRRCHPGEDFNCRCVAYPLLAIDDLSLPLEPKDTYRDW